MLEEVKQALKNKKRGRTDPDTPTSTTKRSRKNGTHPIESTPPATAQPAWKPPAGSWEDDIADLDACEDEETGKLMVYLTWKNGHKTQHETSVIYKRCPQKVSRTPCLCVPRWPRCANICPALDVTIL
jgi:chromobox protein 1